MPLKPAPSQTVGRDWPDRRHGERRQVLDTTVDIDPTQAWLAEQDRRHQERRQYAAAPVLPSKWSDL